MVRVADLCGQILMSLINNVLELSKLEAQRVQLEKNEVDVQVIIEDTLEMVHIEAEKKGIELLCEVDSSVPVKIIGDQTRLKQILINLLVNACKFSFGGEILIRVTAKNSNLPNEYEIYFSVQDQGIGMTDDAKTKILSPYAQADLTITRRFGGTGLGLAICKHLVELMGGKLWFESKLGKGSTFYFSILFTVVPVVKEEKHSMDSGRKSVAVISSSEKFASIIQNIIEKSLDWKVTHFVSPLDLLKLGDQYHVILTDSKDELADLEAKCKN